MRSFLDPGTRRRPKQRERWLSRFSRERRTRGGARVIRYRRNRELMARQVTVTGLWCAIALMLVPLARSLRHFAHNHMQEQGILLQLALPGLALLAALGCLWRAHLAWREFLDIRREQAALSAELERERTELSRPDS